MSSASVLMSLPGGYSPRVLAAGELHSLTADSRLYSSAHGLLPRAKDPLPPNSKLPHLTVSQLNTTLSNSTNSRLKADPLQSLGTDRIENTAPNNSSISLVYPLPINCPGIVACAHRRCLEWICLQIRSLTTAVSASSTVLALREYATIYITRVAHLSTIAIAMIR
jgi:hypothetical protein